MENYNDYKGLKKVIDAVTHNWIQKVVCIILAIVIVQIYNTSLLEKRYFSVHLEYKYADGFTTASKLPRTVRVSVWGDTSIINSIRDEDITARVDASYIKMEGEHKVAIQFIKNNSILKGESLELHAEPSEININIEKKITKTVAIKLNIEGTTAQDYVIKKTSLEPQIISLEGPSSRLEKIGLLSTEGIKVDNLSSSIDGSVAISNNDPLVSILGFSSVQYKIEIAEKEINQTYQNIEIAIKNLDKKFKIVSYIPKGKVVLSGAKSEINSWKKPRDLLFIDLKNIQEEGEYSTIPIHLAKLSQLHIESFEPKFIHLILEEKQQDIQAGVNE